MIINEKETEMKHKADKFLDITNRLANMLNERDFSQKACIQTGKMECALLQYLHSVKKPVSMNELAKELNVSHSRITRIMDNLVQKSLVARQHSEIDRRRWFATITDEGRKLAEFSEQSILKQQEKVLTKLTAEQADGLYEYLHLYVKVYDEVLKEEGAPRSDF